MEAPPKVTMILADMHAAAHAGETTNETEPRRPSLSGGHRAPGWRLHVIASPDSRQVGHVYDLAVGSTAIGRTPSGSSAWLMFEDRATSRDHVVLVNLGHHAGVEVRDCQSRNGTYVDGVRRDRVVAAPGTVLRFGNNVAVLELDGGVGVEHEVPTVEVPGRSAAARLLRSELALAARSALPVLIRGATGTGKEYASAAIHALSDRTGPLVRFNVAAVQETLFESELFGHVRGAFTGATGHRGGRVREADGGTLVLDEIGELPMAQQARLLRVIEEGLVRPVGGGSDVRIEVKFVGATNADVERRSREGLFRKDLLARLRGHEVLMPLLRERRPDLMDLCDAVAPVSESSGADRSGEPRVGRSRRWRDLLSPEAVETLLLCPWDENLRELRAVLVRVAATARHGGPIGPEQLPAPLRAAWEGRLKSDPHWQPGNWLPATPEPYLAPIAPGIPATPIAPPPAYHRPPQDVLHQLLAAHHGNVEAVASELGRNRRQVYRWMELAGIDRDALAKYRGR